MRSSNLLNHSHREQFDLDACKTRLEEIGRLLKLGKLNEAEADAARLALLAQPRSTSGGVLGRMLGQGLPAIPRPMLAAIAAFVIVSSIGAARVLLSDPPQATSSDHAIAVAGAADDPLAQLKEYAGSIATEQRASTATAPAAGKMLPDVNTMIDKLAARLEANPKDVEGWRTLGWSYFHTERFEQAASAFSRAVDLDPNSAELKRSYDEAKAKASGSAAPTGDGAAVPHASTPGVLPSSDPGAEIRAMVDGLARRLESSPRDAEGWAQLIRSRVVLGEQQLAATAFRKALEIFKGDPAATDTITATALDLGLKAE
jgi:cytochrome c-type biogenesis protein CcmH/NrfG